MVAELQAELNGVTYRLPDAQDLLDAGGECELVAADVSVAADCAAVVDACRETYGRI